MKKGYSVERHFEPINILIVFLLGIASVLFIAASTQTFGIPQSLRPIFSIGIGIVYIISAVYFLRPKKVKKMALPQQTQIIEKEVPVEKIVEKIWRMLLKTFVNITILKVI